MNEQNQIIKECITCNNEREYDDYHRLYVACKICAKERCAKYYQKTETKY